MRWIKLLLVIATFSFANQIELNFQNLKIKDFIRMVAKITNRNILLTENISGNVNFISVKPVNEKEIYEILLNILKSKGYTIVSSNGYLKVIKNADALRELSPNSSEQIYQITTAIIKLNYISAKEVYTQINYLKSRYGKIVVNRDQNLLIVTDYPSNIALIKSILKKLDNQNKKSIVVASLNNSEVGKVYPKLLDIAKGLFDKNIYHYKIIQNENSNSIIVVGDSKVVSKIVDIVAKLDTKPKSLNQITKIVTLKNSDVGNIQKVLTNIINMKYKKEKPSITANNETNSLIMIGSLEQINTLETIIKALDIPKQQVYVKARILEISNLKASQVGAKFGLYAGTAGSSGLYTLSANMGAPAIAFDATALGLTLPTIKKGVALGATLDLLELFGAAKKLSEPSLLCINNTPSTIYVGKTISVKTGQTTSTSTSVSYSRQDVGLTLKITPRIDSDNKVSLNVKSVIEDILPGSPDMTLPTTSKRDIETTTIVNNGQSIIIGGLVRNNKDITVQKVPLLGDIPFLGALFRHNQINEDKTTLVILLTPYIVKKSEDLDKLKETFAKLNAVEHQFAEKFIKEKVAKDENY
jgi:general secretion pathway protein D